LPCNLEGTVNSVPSFFVPLNCLVSLF